MAAPVAWPTGKPTQTNNTTAFPDGNDGWPAPPARAPSDQEAARDAISEMASLLGDTRCSMVTDGCLLGAIAMGLALEAGLSARAPRPVPASVADLALLGGLLVCWLTAVLLIAWAGRAALGALGELRWRTGAPVDPRPAWVSLPPAGADPAQWTWERAYRLVGAARLARSRMHFADTWTYVTGGCFLACTMIFILGS